MNAAPQRLSVLLVPVADDAVSPRWFDEVRAAIGDEHDVRTFDHNAALPPQFADVDVVIDHGGWGTRDMADAGGHLKLWQVLGTGLDHFDVDYWVKCGIPVANCPGTTSAAGLAEHALMLMLMLQRQYVSARARLDRGELYEPMGLELSGRKLGLVGFGASARELARRAHALGMAIRATDVAPISADDQRDYHLDGVVSTGDLDDLLAWSDVVSLHVPLTATTHHLIDAARLERIPRGALLVNVARGALVDEQALLSALDDGRLAGAGLDVLSEEPPNLSSPLFSHPKVVLTPHIAGCTINTAQRRAAVAAENIRRISLGIQPLHLVG